MVRAFQNIKAILDGATAVKGVASNGNGIPMDISDFRHLVLALETSSNASCTIKVQGSIAEVAPDFTAAASPTNSWSYIQIVDLADQSIVNGATGVVLTGTDIARLFEVNTNALKWLNVIVTAYAAGTIYARVKPFNDSAGE